MNYFPCNDIGVLVDGKQRRGILKVRNEYIPICCPENIYRVGSTQSNRWEATGCVSLGGKLRILSNLGSSEVKYGYITTLDNNLWSIQQSVFGLYNRIGVGKKGYCIAGEDMYATYLNQNPGAATINKVNNDGTTTYIATTPEQYIYGGYIASFVNSDGDNCIAIANTSYKDRCYYYNLNTQEWTKFTLELPSGYTVGDIYSSTEENVILCITSDGNKMYKYNFSNNTYTDISNWSTLTENQNKVGRVNKTFWRIPVICNEKVYYFLSCNIDIYYSSSSWQTKNIFVVLDENGNVIFVPIFAYEDKVLSVCGHDNCIYILCDTVYDTYNSNIHQINLNRIGKFYKFDPKTRRMYDMSIPHLVIDE